MSPSFASAKRSSDATWILLLLMAFDNYQAKIVHPTQAYPTFQQRLESWVAPF